jgi:hypothetical protein
MHMVIFGERRTWLINLADVTYCNDSLVSVRVDRESVLQAIGLVIRV